MNFNKKIRPKYHFTPLSGWMNDPNGFSFYNNKFHLFYQSHPFSNTQGVMYWGHAVSDDLLIWEHLPHAIAPDKDYDKDGCWSGGATVLDNKHYLMYTGNKILENGNKIQTQNLAESSDGVNYKKYIKNPVIVNKQLQEDFRDPYVCKRKKHYECFIGTKHNNGGKIVKYSSRDLKNWIYVSEFYKEDLGIMFECPSLIDLNDEQILLVVSPQEAKADKEKYYNISSSVYYVGKEKNEVFIPINSDEIDCGFDFYAPMLLKNNNRIIMIAWMQMWGRNLVMRNDDQNYCGSMTLPREIKIKNNKLYQYPIKEIKKMRKDVENYVYNDNFRINQIYDAGEYLFKYNLKNVSEITLSIFKTKDKKLLIKYNKEKGLIEFFREDNVFDYGGVDNEKSKEGYRYKIIGKKEELKLNCFIDINSIEIFINDGEYCFTSLFKREIEEIIHSEIIGNTSVNIDIYKY